MPVVPNYYDDLTSQGVTFDPNLQVGNPTNTYRSLVQNNTVANYGYCNITSMVTHNQLRDRGVPRDIGELTQCHDRSEMPDQEEKSTTRLQMHSTVTSISDMNDIDSHANPSDDGPDYGELRYVGIRFNMIPRNKWEIVILAGKLATKNGHSTPTYVEIVPKTTT